MDHCTNARACQADGGDARARSPSRRRSPDAFPGAEARLRRPIAARRRHAGGDGVTRQTCAMDPPCRRKTCGSARRNHACDGALHNPPASRAAPEPASDPSTPNTADHGARRRHPRQLAQSGTDAPVSGRDRTARRRTHPRPRAPSNRTMPTGSGAASAMQPARARRLRREHGGGTFSQLMLDLAEVHDPPTGAKATGGKAKAGSAATSTGWSSRANGEGRLRRRCG
jgi:copper resistance protein B